MQPQNVDLTISKSQEIAGSWIKTIDARYFNELTNMAILTEEVVRVIART